jgi:tetratricopeptide (TPR) repeat protein
MDRIGPPHWIGQIAPLERAARGDSLAMADAHYGIARILNASGDYAEASEHLGAGWDAAPERFSLSDAPAALLSSCSTRIRQLAARGRWVDTVSAHEQCWRPELTPLDGENNTLRDVAVAYDRLGLPDKALRVLRASLSARSDTDNHKAADLVILMHLYVESDKPLEALETMESLADPSPTAHFVAAQAHTMLGRVASAEASLRQAGLADTPWRESVDIERGILLADAERCEEAMSLLEQLPAAPAHPITGPNSERYLDALLRRASCAVHTESYSQAYQDARDLLGHETASEIHKERAAWIIANAGIPQDLEPVPTTGLSGRVLALRSEITDLTNRLEDRGVSSNN